ncbi:MAG: type I-E CRISPR-associated protein Cas6/Cse3/CasE [Candidatus Dadabacteria bacterium]|nr:MAG: type I-E CRISPR-associated protein Cas6/Cse3/CasE [Candidatus Dadabacteria bacterium]
MTMITSLLTLTKHDVQALKIKDPYSLHRVVYSLYEDVRNEDEKRGSKASGFLYADLGGDFKGRKILLLSNREPKPVVDGTPLELLSKPVPEKLLDYDRYRFKVVVNPTRRDNNSRKLVPVRGKEEILNWFVERASNSWGFIVAPDEIQLDDLKVLSFKAKKGQQVTISQAAISGILAVKERDRFKHSFTHGIGRARAFGCGLLQVVPISN